MTRKTRKPPKEVPDYSGASKFALGYQGSYQTSRKSTRLVEKEREDDVQKYGNTDILQAFAVGAGITAICLIWVIKVAL